MTNFHTVDSSPTIRSHFTAESSMNCSSVAVTVCKTCEDVFKKSCSAVKSFKIDDRKLYVKVSQYFRLINSISDRIGDVLITKQSIRLSVLKSTDFKCQSKFNHCSA